MMMSTSRPSAWQIYHARFNYSEGKGYKYRPVIVLGSNDDGMLVVMVTSSTNKLNLDHDYKIRDWQEAGLDKPSIARLDRIAEIPPNYIGSSGYIGKLTQYDINNIIQIIISL